MKRHEVLMLAAAFLASVSGGLDPALAAITLGAWFDRYFLPGVQQSKRSWRDDLSRFNAHIRPVLGDMPVARITAFHVQQLVTGLRPSINGYRNLERLSDATTNRVIALLKGKRPIEPPCPTRYWSGKRLSGSNSSSRLNGQAGNFSTVSLSQA